MQECKRCLLLEAGEKVTYEELMRYIEALPKDGLVSLDEYTKRIDNCKNCDNLISGMCLKCGCYVEVRARLKNQNCPDMNKQRW